MFGMTEVLGDVERSGEFDWMERLAAFAAMQ